MKKLIGLFVFTMILSVGMASLSHAAGDMAAPGSQTMVKGDLLKIDGEFYVVKDMAGKEIRLHVDKTSKLDGAFKAGDKVEAQATEKDHAGSIDTYSQRSRFWNTKIEVRAQRLGQYSGLAQSVPRRVGRLVISMVQTRGIVS